MIHIQQYTYTCRNKINNNDERTHFFRKIYLILYSKWLRKGYERVMFERWVGDWTNCNILTPSSFVFSSTSFSFCWAAQSGCWGPIAFCWVLVLSTASYRQLTDSKKLNLSVAPGYIIVWHPPTSSGRLICTQFNPSTVKVIPWYLRPNAPVSRLTAGSKVNMLHHYTLQRVRCLFFLFEIIYKVYLRFPTRLQAGSTQWESCSLLSSNCHSKLACELKAFAGSEIQSPLFGIWTWVTGPIFKGVKYFLILVTRALTMFWRIFMCLSFK